MCLSSKRESTFLWGPVSPDRLSSKFQFSLHLEGCALFQCCMSTLISCERVKVLCGSVSGKNRTSKVLNIAGVWMVQHEFFCLDDSPQSIAGSLFFNPLGMVLYQAQRFLVFEFLVM